MASSITNASLKVKISEEIELNGKQQGGTYEKIVSGSINEIAKRRLTIINAEATIASFHASQVRGGGTFIQKDIRYMRFTNLSNDKSKHITLTFIGSSTHEFAVKLVAGGSFVLMADNTDTALNQGVLKYFDAAAAALTVSFLDLLSVTASCSSSAGQDLEMFIASV